MATVINLDATILRLQAKLKRQELAIQETRDHITALEQMRAEKAAQKK